uniref:DH domain-containing protein n=1 Tax=Labrus bergylta TaxID=56723 RepID=A0A3Q3LWJ3_9LABR
LQHGGAQEASARKKSEEDEKAAKERAAQRQLLAIEELVMSERNYLRLLQVSTVTIRSNLQQLQPPLTNLDSMFQYIEDVINVSSRLLSLLDQKQIQPGDPLYLETLCKGSNYNIRGMQCTPMYRGCCPLAVAGVGLNSNQALCLSSPIVSSKDFLSLFSCSI